jgi:hypothetical protein
MSIIASEIKWYQAEEMSDATTNGGKMSATEAPDLTKNAIFPDVPQSERTAGSTKYRKVFIKIANDDDLTFFDPKIFVENYTPGDDSIMIFAGTQTDTQNDITGSERVYGAGQLDADVSAAAGSITVATEGAAFAMFQDGDTIRISDKADIDGAGNEEYHVISGAPSYAVDVATINLVGTLANGYTAASTRVTSVIEPADILSSFDTFVDTSAATGVYDETGGNLTTDSIGTVEDSWTLTFTDATNFDAVGANSGAVGSGTTGAGISPLNADFSKPYFTLGSAGFSGTWQAGDTITFNTHPAALPVWYKRVVPAGAASYAGNKVVVAADGESA